MPASTANRAARPRSFAIARARTVSHLGRSSSRSDGSGSAPKSSTPDIDELPRRILASEPQEDLLQPLGVRIGVLAQLVHRTARADGPLRDDRHPVAQRLRDLEGVGAHHDRVTAMGVLAEQVLENSRRLGIEPHHRLVHHDHLRPVHEGAGDDQLLAHAMAVALHELVAPGLEIEQRQQLTGAVLHLGALLVVQAGDEAQKLCAGELLIYERAVRDEAELHLGPHRILRQVHTGNGHLATGRAQDAGDHAERRRFSGAVRPEKSEQLPAWNFEIDRVHGGEAAVALGEPAETDHARTERRARLVRSSSRRERRCAVRP
jgi:hypothetical protein